MGRFGLGLGLGLGLCCGPSWCCGLPAAGPLAQPGQTRCRSIPAPVAWRV